MTRVKISGAVLLILLAVSTFAGIWVNRRCDGMLRDIERLSTAAENGQTEVLSPGAEELNGKWEHFRSRASFLVRYDKLVEADRLCSRITELSESEDTELRAELAELHDMLEMLKSGETPLMNSVF